MPDFNTKPFAPTRFPSVDGLVRARWAPIMLSPIFGSPEQFVIGVAAVSDSGFHIEKANKLDRLNCIFGDSAFTTISIAEVTLEGLALDIAERGYRALTEPRAYFSGVKLGRVTDGQAPTVEEVARSWMASLSSLYEADLDLELEEAVPEEIARGASNDPLSIMVLMYVSERRPEISKYFNINIREQRRRRRSSQVYGVFIDFAGSNIVANFGTLTTNQRANSVNKIKRQMLDLILNRDKDSEQIKERDHEMIIQHRPAYDPQISEKQYEDIQEAIRNLSDQAKREEINLLAMEDVPNIGDHLLEMEKAA